jgi:flagellar M-ring protein FliF
MILLLMFSLQPDYALLYGNLDLKDASLIVQELDSQNVKYKLRGGGKDIYVPLKRRDNMRLILAEKDMLPSTTTGYELFDKNKLTLSNFQQNVDYQRALEGELSRTLMSLVEVEFARVHLVIPEPSPFLEEHQQATASVVLKLKGATRLNPSKMAAVANLVATAVSGLDPGSITIMDDQANILAGGQKDDFGFEPLPNQQKYLGHFEEALKQKIKMVLDPAYGLGNTAIAVSAELDFNKVEEETTEFIPLTGTDTGVVRSSETTETTSQNQPQESGGTVGATANLPTYQGTSSSSGSTSKSSESAETKNYEISQTQKTTQFAMGAVKKISVSVLLNAETLESAEQTELENLVKNAVNFNDTRGDTLTVAAQVFDTTFQQEVEAAQKVTLAAASKRMYITYGLIALAAILLGLALFRLMKPYDIPSSTLTARGTAGAAQVREELPEIDLMSLHAPDTTAQKLRHEVIRMTKDNPENAAKVIKTWLKE